MEPQGRTIASPFHTRRRGKTFHPSKTTLRIRVHVQAVGLNAKTKNRSALSRRGKFSLDIPFYRTRRFFLYHQQTFPLNFLVRVADQPPSTRGSDARVGDQGTVTMGFVLVTLPLRNQAQLDR